MGVSMSSCLRGSTFSRSQHRPGGGEGGITTTWQVCVVISSFCRESAALPGNVDRFCNVTEGLKAVLYQVRSLVEEGESSDFRDDVEPAIQRLFLQSKERLLLLEDVLSRIRNTSPKQHHIIFRTLAWRRRKKKPGDNYAVGGDTGRPPCLLQVLSGSLELVPTRTKLISKDVIRERRKLKTLCCKEAI